MITVAMYVLGVDFGSMASKAIILDQDQKIVASGCAMKGAVSEEGVEVAVNEALYKAGLELKNLSQVVSTGYGRRKLDFVNRTITEITCHARGAVYLFPDCRTVIDIGGQDSKVIRIDTKGLVEKSLMNDRCAAGSGRFLEVLAGALQLDLDVIGEMSLQATEQVTVSSMCTVFAETEVISLLAEGKEKKDILGGVHRAIAGRVAGMARKLGIAEPVAMTGGVSRNIGLVRALEETLRLEMRISPISQLAGALGAALYAWDDATGKEKLFQRSMK